MRGRRRGQAMVEFALVALVAAGLILGSIDIFRGLQANEAVNSAARQAARQGAAAIVTGENPWDATPAGLCSGTSPAAASTGTGCLTNQALLDTARSVMSGFDRDLTLVDGATASTCGTPSEPGSGFVCVWPAAAERKNQWSGLLPGAAHYVQVTVVYRYPSLTPFLNQFTGGLLVLRSTSRIRAEY